MSAEKRDDSLRSEPQGALDNPLETQATEADDAARRPAKLVRVLLLGTALAIPFAFWLQYAELVVHESLFAVESALPLPALTGLLLLVMVRAILRAAGRGHWLPRGEILLVYSFLLITVPLASFGLVQPLLAHLSVGHCYADATNNYDRVLQFLPSWVVPRDTRPLAAIFKPAAGGSSYAFWVVPIAKWMVFLGACFCFLFCLSLMVEDQWAVAERLRFPLVVPALELTAEGPTRLLDRPLARDPVLWLGIAVATLLNGSAIIHAFNEKFPVFNYFYEIKFDRPPWSAGSLRMSYRPIILGVAYLAPTSLSLSIWLFELVKSAQRIVGEALGLSALRGSDLSTNASRFPYQNEQALGAFIFITAATLWVARRHILSVLRTFFQEAATQQQRRMRLALIGLAASAALMLVWLAVGGFWSGGFLLFLVLIVFIAVTVSRIRAEAGPPLVWVAPYRPELMLFSIVGTAHFAPVSLAQMSVLGFMSRSYFPFLMANQLECLKMARESLVRRKDLTITLFAALVVGTVAGVWSLLHFWYGMGAENLSRLPINSAKQSYDAAVAHLQQKSSTDPYALIGIAAGFLFTGLLAWIRRMVWYWPIHPLGYAISQTPPANHMWFMFFLAWAVKSSVMAYGGVKLFRRTLPFFLGLIFGQIGMLIAGNLVRAFFNVRFYISAM